MYTRSVSFRSQHLQIREIKEIRMGIEKTVTEPLFDLKFFLCYKLFVRRLTKK
jgi:hypothetical protein